MITSRHEKLTKSVELQITDDWQREFPGLSVYRPRHLLRRLGPILVGLCLDRDSGGDVYKPCFHVHFLGKEFPAVSLTLCTQLLTHAGGLDFVEVRFHQEKYQDAVSRFREQSPLALEGPLELSRLVEVYREYVLTPLGRRQGAVLYADVIMLLAWAGRSLEAEDALSEVLNMQLAESAFRVFRGKEGFEKEMLQYIGDRVRIDNTVREQISFHGLGEVLTDSLVV